MALAEVEVGGSVSGRATYANNPFLIAGNDTDAGSVSVTLAPVLTAEMATGTLQLGARIDFTQYTRLYGSEDSYAADASLRERLSPKLTLRAGAGFASTVQGQNLLGFADEEVVGEPGLPLPGEDVTLNGQRQRRTSYTANIGFDWALSPRQQWTIDAATALTRYPRNTIAQDYNYYTAKLGFLQKVTANLSAGLSGDVSRTDYRGFALGDADIYGAQANLAWRFDGRWEASFGIGAQFAQVTQIAGTDTRTSFSGFFNLCRTGAASKLCVFASRAVLPTALGSVRPLTSGGASYNLRLTRRSSFAASASFSRYSGTGTPLAVSNGFIRGSVSYSNRLTRTLSAVVSAGYSDSFNDLLPRKANPSASIGLSFDLGNGI